MTNYPNDIPAFAVCAGVKIPVNTVMGQVVQQFRDDGGFHWQDDIFFKRLEDGSVQVRFPIAYNGEIISFTEWCIPPMHWASIVSSVSAQGETLERWNEAQDFHGR